MVEQAVWWLQADVGQELWGMVEQPVKWLQAEVGQRPKGMVDQTVRFKLKWSKDKKEWWINQSDEYK